MSQGRQALETTTAFFDSASGFWRDLYEREGLEGVIYRERMQTALDWVKSLPLGEGTSVLDAGCGAGLLCVLLAEEGLTVTGTDASPAMLQRAAEQVRARGQSERVTLAREDVHHLSFPAQSFDIVVALGLLPWVHDERGALRELARVLKPGGTLILTADNRLRLGVWVEPRLNPVLAPIRLVRRANRRLRGQSGTDGARWRLHFPRQVDRMATGAGLTPVRRAFVGFGPFTFLDRTVLGDRLGLWVHDHLDRLGRRWRPLRRTAWHYMLQARKSEGEQSSSPSASS